MQLSSIKLTIVGSTQRDIEDLLRPTGAKPATAYDIAGVAKGDAPDVVVLDVRHTRALPAGVAELNRQSPTTGIVIVAPSLDPTLMLEAMNAGAKGFVAAPLTSSELIAAIERVVAPTERKQAGRVIAFIGAKGGVGTTILAVNAGTVLARLAKGETLLIDLNARYGDAAAYLGAEPRFTVSDALDNAQKLDLPYMRGLVVKVSGELEVLAAASRIAAGPPDLSRLRALLDFAKRQYRFVVLDVPRTDVYSLDALDDVTLFVVVVSQELTAVRSAARLLETLRQRYGPDRVRIVIGREDRDAEILPEDLEKTLGGPVRVFPSEHRRALGSLNRGKPLVLENHSRLSAEVGRFVREFAGIAPTKAAPEKASLLPKWLRGGSA